MSDAIYTPAHVANYFLGSAYNEKKEITPLKLMKMVYFSYAWYLAMTDNKLFNDDIQAWKHGPVIPSLYHEFKHYGLYGNITGKLATHIYLDDHTLDPVAPFFEDHELSKKGALNFSICGIWLMYKDKSGEQLEEISHGSDSAWSRFYEPGKNISLLKGKNDTETFEKLELIRSRAKAGFKKMLKKLNA